MRQKRELVSKYKLGKIPKIQAGFIYTEARQLSVSPFSVTTCVKHKSRRFSELRHRKPSILVEGSGTIAKWRLAKGAHDDSV